MRLPVDWSARKYWYCVPGSWYGPKASSWTPYLPKESSIQYRFMVWKLFSACGLFRKSAYHCAACARGTSCACAVGVPNTVPFSCCVIASGVPGKSVTTSATFHFFTVGWMLGSE